MDLLTANDLQGEYPRSYYAAHATPLDRFPKAQGALTADVCIVGGGFTGLSAALHLARRGYSVRLLEAQRVGFGASGRNGGQVGTGQRRDQDDLEAMVGKATARRLWSFGLEAVALVRNLSKEIGEECPFTPGIVHAEHRARNVPHSLAYAEKLNRDYDYDLIRGLDLDEMRATVASQAYHGGTLDMGAGHVDPLRYALGLARLARDAGVQIHEETRVDNIEEGRAARVIAGDASVSADT